MATETAQQPQLEPTHPLGAHQANRVRPVLDLIRHGDLLIGQRLIQVRFAIETFR